MWWWWWWSYLQGEGPQYDAAEDGVPVDALEDVPLSMDLPGVDFVEELHHDEHVEHDGVVLRRRWVQGTVTAVVDVEKLLTWETKWEKPFSETDLHKGFFQTWQ